MLILCTFTVLKPFYFNTILDGGGADEGSLTGEQPTVNPNPRMSIIANTLDNGANISVIKAPPVQQPPQNNGVDPKKSIDQTPDRKISQAAEKSSGAGSTKPAQKRSRACRLL
jgi:hypothetical protein